MNSPGFIRSMLSVARSVINLVHDDSKMQSLQLSILKRETRDYVERFQEYGFTSKPHPGAEAVVVFVGGNRDHGLVVAVDDRRYRVKALQDGEVCIYTDEGDKVHFKRGREIEITTATVTVNASTKVDIFSPNANFSGNITANGDIKDRAQGTGKTMKEMRDIYNAHHQTVTGGVAQPPTEQM